MKKITSLLLFIVFISMNVMSQSYMTYHFEQHKFGDDVAILEMLDNWHQKYGVSYKSGAFQLFDVENNSTDKQYDFLCLNRRMRDGKLLLLKELKERGLLKNTLYSYVSDNLVTTDKTVVEKKQPEGDLSYGE